MPSDPTPSSSGRSSVLSRHASSGQRDKHDWSDWRLWIGSAFGLGLSPIVPGSCAALLGVGIHAVILWTLPSGQQWLVLAAAFAVVSALHFWLTPWAQKYFDDPDPSNFVLDEVSGYLFVPLVYYWVRLPAGLENWKLIVAGYLAFRVLDIIKVPPARQVDQQMHTACGVVLDDWISAFLAVGVLLLLANYTSWLQVAA